MRYIIYTSFSLFNNVLANLKLILSYYILLLLYFI
jgi:hypothetical protein